MAKTLNLMYDTVQLIEKSFQSELLERDVQIDFYFPLDVPADYPWELLLINDGQDLVKMDFAGILDRMYAQNEIYPVLAVGIYAGKDRKLPSIDSGFPGSQPGPSERRLTEDAAGSL